MEENDSLTPEVEELAPTTTIAGTSASTVIVPATTKKPIFERPMPQNVPVVVTDASHGFKGQNAEVTILYVTPVNRNDIIITYNALTHWESFKHVVGFIPAGAVVIYQDGMPTWSVANQAQMFSLWLAFMFPICCVYIKYFMYLDGRSADHYYQPST